MTLKTLRAFWNLNCSLRIKKSVRYGVTFFIFSIIILYGGLAMSCKAVKLALGYLSWIYQLLSAWRELWCVLPLRNEFSTIVPGRAPGREFIKLGRGYRRSQLWKNLWGKIYKLLQEIQVSLTSICIYRVRYLFWSDSKLSENSFMSERGFDNVRK